MSKLEIGDIAICDFTGRHGGRHFGLVVELREGGYAVVARGTTWRPWESGTRSRWLPSSLLVEDDELNGTGLHHATRFGLETTEGFSIKSRDFRRVGRLPETENMRSRWIAARRLHSKRPA